MSDAPQGEGWWQASDGKWYPPEQQPGGATGATPGQPAAGGSGTLDIGQALSYGWNGFVKNLGAILVIWLIVIAVQILFSIGSQSTSSIVLSMLISIVGWIVSLIIQAGLIRVGLAVTDGRAVEPSLLWQTDNLGPYVVATLLFGLAVFVGLFALCIGAFIVAFFLWFYGFFALDQGQDPIEALKSSFEMVKDNAGSVFLYALVAILLSIVTCGLAAPVVQIASAYVYRTLTGRGVAPIAS